MKNSKGMTALEWCVHRAGEEQSRSTRDKMLTLIRAGAKIGCALHLAILHHQSDIVETLIITAE